MTSEERDRTLIMLGAFAQEIAKCIILIASGRGVAVYPKPGDFDLIDSRQGIGQETPS